MNRFPPKSTSTPSNYSTALPGSFKFDEPEVKPEIPKPARAAEENDQERTCRICFDGEEGSGSRLISPCKCKGTAKYIHAECLNAWRQASTGKTSAFKCDQCQYSYKLSRTTISSLLTHPVTLITFTAFLLFTLVFISGFIASFIIELVEERSNSSSYGGGFFGGGFFGGYGYGFGDHLLVGESIKTASSLFEESIDRFRPFEGDYSNPIWRRALSHCLKGLSLVGITSFLQLSFSTLFFSPWGLRSSLFRMFNPRRRNGEDRGGLGVSELVLISFVLFGVFKTVQRLYSLVQDGAKKVLARLEIYVADVD